MDVVLVGLPGSGKSAVGRRLAQRHGTRLVDLDELIVADAGQTIAEIFAGEGEPGFRARERAAVDALGPPDGSDGVARVIATGGGAARSSAVAWPPINAVSSASTILMKCWLGVRLARTSCPRAWVRTRSVKSLTTWKWTSASSSASRTSRTASSTLRSVILPRPRSLRIVCSNFSLSVSNMVVTPAGAGSHRFGRGRRYRNAPRLSTNLAPGRRGRGKVVDGGRNTSRPPGAPAEQLSWLPQAQVLPPRRGCCGQLFLPSAL